jgi:hypothetical protein
MSKYIDTDLLVDLVRKTIKLYEDQIDNASPEVRESIRLTTEQGVMAGHVDSDSLNFSFEEIMSGLGLCDLANKIVGNCHNLLCDPNMVRSVRLEGSTIIIDSRPLSESEIAANAAMGVNDLEQFIANINRNKE